MDVPKLKILDESNKILRKKSEDVVFPLSNDDKKLINEMMDYLECSQIEEIADKYNLRAGMGLAYPQLGILKRIFVVVNAREDDAGFDRYVVINPQIKSFSEEMIYVGEGEGCLSVNRETMGIVPRHARITVKAFDLDGKEYVIRVREEVAIAFQHEIDHLNGILFVDHIDKSDPFKGMANMREI